ncbi:MAG: universal stress protein [Bacteroidales bacterium]|nr:universal stress protein [Bacteroidales bacterium]
MELNKPILVPWDFSQVADYALQHAIEYSKVTGDQIALVHVVKKQKEIQPAKIKLEETVKKTKNEYGVDLELIVREGSIFTSISDIVDEVNATLVIMGTHGMKGMQKFTGSWALKVIAGTSAPFVVVQAPPVAALSDIIFPVDFKKEQKEKLVWAGYLVNHYKAKIHICYQPSSDTRIKAKTKSNLIFSKNYLAEKQANFEIVTLPGKKAISDESIDLAREMKAGMILIMTTKNISFQDYVLGADEQQIIANPDKIPVMCVNPKKGTNFGGFSATGA